MKKDFVVPVLVLSLICLFVSGVLAVGNAITQPIIQAAAIKRAHAAMMEAVPHADGFERLEAAGLPRSITAVYSTTNNVGYVFIVSASGFGGEMRILCAIDPDGIIIRTMVLSNSETPAFAAPVFAQEHLYVGNDRSLAGINVISGSTITFDAYRNAVLAAFDAFDIVSTGIDAEEMQRQREEAAIRAAIPHAEALVPVNLEGLGLPENVISVYGTTNNVGFVFSVITIGYGGEMNVLCAIDPNGIIISTHVLWHNETPMFATMVFMHEHLYIGNDRSLTGIDLVSGATMTFEAYRDAVLYAFEAFDIVREVQF